MLLTQTSSGSIKNAIMPYYINISHSIYPCPDALGRKYISRMKQFLGLQTAISYRTIDAEAYEGARF